MEGIISVGFSIFIERVGNNKNIEYKLPDPLPKDKIIKHAGLKYFCKMDGIFRKGSEVPSESSVAERKKKII